MLAVSMNKYVFSLYIYILNRLFKPHSVQKEALS